MLHIYNVYYFIDKFDRDEIIHLNKNINIIYRNYQETINKKLLIEIKNICKQKKTKFYLANDLEFAIKLDLDGVYIPSFNQKLIKKYSHKKNFEILGSAHNQREIHIKEKQGVNKIFLSPVFMVKKRKTFLGVTKFNLLRKYTKKKVIALGGINKKNINQIKLLNCSGFASISYLKGRTKY